jgi:hypothetical protein
MSICAIVVGTMNTRLTTYQKRVYKFSAMIMQLIVKSLDSFNLSRPPSSFEAPHKQCIEGK